MANAQIMINSDTMNELRNGGFSLFVVTASGNNCVVSSQDQEFMTEMTVALDSDERALLMFSNAPLDVGTPVSKLPSPGVLLDLTQNSDPQVQFDINEGWVWDGLPWATAIPPGSEAAPYLIEAAETRLA
jgi:hypothetical protein